MNKALISLLQQNSAGKVGRGKRDEEVEGEIPQEKQQPGLLRQCNYLAESSNCESSNEEEDDSTTCKICKIPWIELTQRDLV